MTLDLQDHEMMDQQPAPINIQEIMESEDYFMAAQRLGALAEEQQNEIFRLRMSIAMMQERLQILNSKLEVLDRHLNQGKYIQQEEPHGN